MKKMKQTLALFLAFIMLMTTVVFASEEIIEEGIAEQDFSYSISDVTFMSRDLAKISINFYGTTGELGIIDTNCFIPVYDGDSNQLVDVFYFPITIENPFADYYRRPYTAEIRLTNPALQEYRFKLIMLDSLETLSPEGSVNQTYSGNELIVSNVDHYKFVQFDGKISYAPLHNDETDVSFKILDNVLLFEGAEDAGYTIEDFVIGNTVIVSTQHNNLYEVQGLYCRVMLNILDDGTYCLWWADPIEEYNQTISIKPIDLVTADNGNNEAEYYTSETATNVSRLPLADQVSVYKNYEVASIYDIVPGYHDCITEYRYVDTDIDGLYDTVYIDYEEAFLIGSINRSNYRVFPDFDAMKTFARSSIHLDYEDSYTLFETNLSIEEMNVGQFVRVKESYDNGYTFYDITVENTKTIVGEVTNINTSSGCTRYTIGGTDYRMLTEQYSDVAVGDSIEFVAYDDIIVKYQFVFDANIGVVLDVGIWEEVDIDYQLKLMTQEGKVEVYNLAKKVNGITPNYPNITILEGSFPVGSMLTYYLNENMEICAYDVQGGGTSNTLKNGERIGTVSGEYKRKNAKLGSYFITGDTIFFATDSAQADVTENNIVVSDSEILENEQSYNYGILYDINKNALAVILYEVQIEDTQEVLSEISYGVITEVYYNETFEPICTLQILNQDGKQESHLLSSVVNGEKITFDSAVALAEEFPRGELIAYRIDDKNEIRRVDTLSGIHMGNVLENTQFVSFDSTYRNYAFGNYKITDATVLTGTSAGKAAEVSEENTALVTKMDLIEGANYKGVGVINSSNELLFSFTYNTTSSIINPDSYPIIITKRAIVPTADNPEKIKYWGYVNGEEVIFSVADNASEAAKNLDNGDAALYTINRIDEITDALVLAKKTEDGYVVLDNAINGIYETAYLESDANHTFLSTENYSEPTSAAEAKAIAETMMSTQAAECKLAGFATAGKGYAVSVSTVRLVDANNYADTFVNGERNYTEVYDEDRIDDYYVMVNTVAYQFNVKRDKVIVTNIFNAETDKNTYDYHSANQLDNDDFIYIYNYDGETRLVLIVDVKGDN